MPKHIQTTTKSSETLKQVKDMLKNKIIQPSEATAYSQVLFVPKPNNKWRFCIDYRNLNKCCDSSGWPIPNINLMFTRIGSVRAKVKNFAKIEKPPSKSSLHLRTYLS